MLTSQDLGTIRAREFDRLDEADEVYLDYTGSALAAASHVASHHTLGVFGNPHSTHAASRRSAAIVDAARAGVLAHFNVDGATHEVCFTANASAALKLVGESYPFSDASRLVLTADNHNSVNGIREFARRAGARTDILPLAPDLRLDKPDERLRTGRGGAGLFAFPAQSNFSGTIHPLSLVDAAHGAGLDVLLDAAAFVPTHPLDLRQTSAEFVALSFYKMFGYPTGVGALVARRDALEKLRRPWFAGGTVDFVSVQHDRHGSRRGAERFEDGTPNFIALGAIPSGLAFLRDLGMDVIEAHVRELTTSLLVCLQSLRHAGGAPLVAIYGPTDARDRGGTVAFNVLDSNGVALAYEPLERSLSDDGVFVRGGCFCNPGAAEAAFGFDPDRTARCLAALDGDFTVPRFAACLGDGAVVGALRASIGVPTTRRDIERLVGALLLSAPLSNSGAGSQPGGRAR